jgi:hypothetical protein
MSLVTHFPSLVRYKRLLVVVVVVVVVLVDVSGGGGGGECANPNCCPFEREGCECVWVAAVAVVAAADGNADANDTAAATLVSNDFKSVPLLRRFNRGGGVLGLSTGLASGAETVVVTLSAAVSLPRRR